MAEPKKRSAADELAEMIANVPTFAPTLSPVGVPSGYQTEEGKVPQYFDGDQFEPAGWPTERLIQLQLLLDEAGLYSKTGGYNRGRWDDLSIAAYTDLLAQANASGRTTEEHINHLRATPLAAAADRERQPLVTRITNPRDLEEIFEEASLRTIGRRPRKDEVARLVSSYQSLERNYQSALYQLQDEQGGEVVEPPSPEALAEQELEAANPIEAAGVDFRSVFDNFLGAIRSKAGLQSP